MVKCIQIAGYNGAHRVLPFSFWKIITKNFFFTSKKSNSRNKHAKWPPSDLTPWTLTLSTLNILVIFHWIFFSFHIKMTNIFRALLLSISIGTVHKWCRQLVGWGEGVKKWSKLPTDSTKKLQIWGRGVSEKLLTSFMDGPNFLKS